MDYVYSSPAGDLHDSTELSSLQRDLCYPNREPGRYGYSELYSGIFGHIHSGRCRRSDSCRWEWLLVATILLWWLLLSLPGNILWRILRGLRLSLSNALL